MEDASPRDRAAVVVESLAAMDSTEIAETVINISGYQVLQHISGYQVLQHISGYRVLQHISGYQVLQHISGYQVLQHISGFQVLQHISGYQVLQHIFSLIFERHIFDILSIHKPPLAGVMLGPKNILGSTDLAVLTFIGYKQTDDQSMNIDFTRHTSN